MRLEKIVLNGFKSFADKTELRFDRSITAIVGPNGCGKSNVVDAVKWVLGEQSVKSLRSGQMSDVIFSGSSSRKALGSAEVSLVFSNTSGKLAIEADEVEISRRIYRSGESEYRINGKICRLKDIRETFMDTGVAAKAYSIIEQGQVAQLLTASKADRRVIFEEAAGISKYKAHKKEALRKLERTEQNLLRLADILGEVQKQLRSVKLQAGKARNYLAYSERLKELQVNYSLVEYHKNATSEKEKRAILAEIEQQSESLAVEVARNDALMSELGDEIIEAEHKVNETDNSLVSVQSRIEQQLQRIEFLRSRITELEAREKTAAKRIDNIVQQKKGFEAEVATYRQQQSECEVLLEEKKGSVEQLAESIRAINAECIALEADLEDEKSGIIDIVRHTAQLHNEVQSISVYRNNLSNQKDRLAGRANSARTQLEELLTARAQLQARLGDIEKNLEELTANLNSKREKSEQLLGQIEIDKGRMANSKEALSALSSELTILADMESRREGLNNAVKSILSQRNVEAGRFDYVEDVLADIVAADVEYASAVEAALEGRTDALVSQDTNKLLSDADTIDKLDGRVNFLCSDMIEPFVDKMDLSSYEQIRGRVVEFAKYDGRYAGLVWKLLGKVLIVDSIESARNLSSELGSDYEFVTMDGRFLGQGGVIKVGPLGKASGLISRKSRLRQLRETIDKLAAEISVIEQELENNTGQNAHLLKLCKELRTAVYEANTEKMQVNSKMSSIEENINRLKEEQPLIAGEMEQLEEQIAQSVEKEYNSKQKLDELEEVNRQRKVHIEQLEANFGEKKQQQRELADELTEHKVILGQAIEQSKAIRQTIVSLENQIRSSVEAVEAARAETGNCSQQCVGAQRDILACESSVSELFVEKEKTQAASRKLHEKIRELLEKQKETEQLVRQKRSQESEVDGRINELKIELGQLTVKQEGLIERVREELGLELAESYKSYQQAEDQTDWEAVREEMTMLRTKIDRLGNVNVDAIEEQEALEQRNEFLSQQVEDLNSSKSQLQQLIVRLNKKSREKFAETFEQIRIHFQELFRKLFGGGKADILLEDAEDILDAGVEIVARPPGKETRSISLLSGGEKTMTAIAMLFAVFKTKPSPFCILDEVDAALDEANNERFNMIISEFQKTSQFIIITHAKRTMSIADILYGITMQTRGVSKKISVKFDDYEPEQDEETAAVA